VISLTGQKESKLKKLRRVSRNLKLRLRKARTQGKISLKKKIPRQQRVACNPRKINMKMSSLKRRQKK